MSIKIYLHLFLLTEFSLQLSLMELFPESEGDVLPPLRMIQYIRNRQLINLRRIVNDDMSEFDEHSALVARGHVIIGWNWGDVILPVSDLFGETDNVFDTNNNKFEKLLPGELWRLGVGRHYSTVERKEIAAAALRTAAAVRIANRQVHRQALRQAHDQATYEANLQAIRQGNIQVNSRTTHQVNYQVNHQGDNEAKYQSQAKYHINQDYLRNHRYN